MKLGRTEEALELVNPLVTERQSDPWRNAVLGACKAAAKDWLQALGYLQSAYVGGCHDPFCLRWLVVTLISNGQMEAARPVLNEWLQREPTSAEAHAYLERMESDKPGGEASRSYRVDRATNVGDVSAPVPPLDTTTTGPTSVEADA